MWWLKFVNNLRNIGQMTLLIAPTFRFVVCGRVLACSLSRSVVVSVGTQTLTGIGDISLWRQIRIFHVSEKVHRRLFACGTPRRQRYIASGRKVRGG